MSRESRAFLDLVRDAHDPTPADEERVLLALKATLASATFEQTRWAEPSPTLGAAGWKLSVVAVCTAAAFFGTADTPRAVQRGPGNPASSAIAAPVLAPASISGPTQPAAPDQPSPVQKPADLSPPDAEPAPPTSHARAATLSPLERGVSSLRAELDLLHRVQLALQHGDGAAALRALDAHRTSDRALLAERQAARILALCNLGRVAEARSAARNFARAHPDSVQREAIASSCANSRRIDRP